MKLKKGRLPLTFQPGLCINTTKERFISNLCTCKCHHHRTDRRDDSKRGNLFQSCKHKLAFAVFSDSNPCQCPHFLLPRTQSTFSLMYPGVSAGVSSARMWSHHLKAFQFIYWDVERKEDISPLRENRVRSELLLSLPWKV